MAVKEERPFQTEISSFRTLDAFEDPRSISDDSLSDLLGFMPVGRSLRTTPTLYNNGSFGTSKTFVRCQYFSVMGGTFMLAFASDGSLYVFSGTGTIDSKPAGTFSNPQFAQWSDDRVLIIDPTAGYYSFRTAITVIDATIKGTSIASYQGRVFIANVTNIQYSAPGSYTDFNVANGAGAFSDPYISIQSINRMMVVGDQLYAIGPYAVHGIIGVTLTVGNGTYDGYQAIELLPLIGTDSVDTIAVHSSNLYFVQRGFVHIVSGASVATLKIPARYFTLGTIGFIIEIYDIKLYCFSVTYGNSPLGQVFMCMLLDGSRWFYAPMTDILNPTLTVQAVAAGQNLRSVTCIFKNGAGANFWGSLFTNQSSATRRIKTKSFNMGNFFREKRVMRAGVLITMDGGDLPNTISPTISVVSDKSSTTDALPMDTYLGDDLTTLAAKSFDSPGQGKSLAVQYQETGDKMYTITGLLAEGTMGAEW